MDRSTTLELAALAATALAAIGVVPQLRRLLRTEDLEGLSLSYATLGMASELAWIGYTLHGRLWSAVLEPVLMTTTNATLAVVMVRAGMSPWRPVLAGLAWGGVLASAAMLFGVAALAALLPLAYAVQVAPSIWSAYRTFSPSGVAGATWALVGAEALLWGVYGLAHQDPAMTTFAVVGVLAAMAILVRKVTTRQRNSPVHVAT